MSVKYSDTLVYSSAIFRICNDIIGMFAGGATVTAEF